MKKLALALLLVVCGVSADDYEEFLEYKKWQEQKAKSQSKKDTAKSPKDASKDVKDAKSSDSTNSQKSTKTAETNAKSSQDSIKDMQDKDKNAGFIGLEVGFNLGSKAKFIDDGSTKTYSGIFQDDNISSFNALNASLIGGYQWYFSDMMGVGVRGLVGYNGSVDFTSFALTSIIWGIEAQYLLDFTQNVGMNIGVGFEASHLLYDDKLISSSVFVPAFSISVGLNFHTANLKHNFGITYRYKTYKTKMIKTGYTTMEFSQGKAGLVVFSYYYRF